MIEKIFGTILVALAIYLYERTPTCRKLFAWSRFLWTRRKLILYLEKHNVDHGSWQYIHGAYVVDDLLKALRSGEVWLESNEDFYFGKPYLHVNVAVATVLCKHMGRPQILREFRCQRNGDWDERPFTGSLAKKIRPYEETAVQAIIRGLGEELGETQPGFKDPGNFILIYNKDETTRSTHSDRHSGLIDVYHQSLFTVIIDKELYWRTYEKTGKGHSVQFRWKDYKKATVDVPAKTDEYVTV